MCVCGGGGGYHALGYQFMTNQYDECRIDLADSVYHALYMKLFGLMLKKNMNCANITFRIRKSVPVLLLVTSKLESIRVWGFLMTSPTL